MTLTFKDYLEANFSQLFPQIDEAYLSSLDKFSIELGEVKEIKLFFNDFLKFFTSSILESATSGDTRDDASTLPAQEAGHLAQYVAIAGGTGVTGGAYCYFIKAGSTFSLQDYYHLKIVNKMVLSHMGENTLEKLNHYKKQNKWLFHYAIHHLIHYPLESFLSHKFYLNYNEKQDHTSYFAHLKNLLQKLDGHNSIDRKFVNLLYRDCTYLLEQSNSAVSDENLAMGVYTMQTLEERFDFLSEPETYFYESQIHKYKFQALSQIFFLPNTGHDVEMEIKNLVANYFTHKKLTRFYKIQTQINKIEQGTRASEQKNNRLNKFLYLGQRTIITPVLFLSHFAKSLTPFVYKNLKQSSYKDYHKWYDNTISEKYLWIKLKHFQFFSAPKKQLIVAQVQKILDSDLGLYLNSTSLQVTPSLLSQVQQHKLLCEIPTAPSSPSSRTSHRVKI